ncbi:RapZ C-terminal domain-containing protein [Streptomyces erythrochromogenes]|uniref:RapZ C-terminal domain-containing protein n=1 Tax=Streptomyces erythrochromogenes TaxID=285574 RepID=UPI0036AE4FCF
MDFSTGEQAWIQIETFGFDHGVPVTPTGALLVDLRSAPLQNPADHPALAGRDGKDEEAAGHVMESPHTFTLLARTADQAQALLDRSAKSNLIVRVLVGDTEGRTRAVVIGDALAEILTARGIRTSVDHHGLTPPAPQK